MSHVRHLKALEQLELYGTKVSGHAARHLEGLSHLTHLDFSGTEIDDRSVPYILRLSNLTELKLGSTQVSSSGLMDLAKLEKLKRLDLRTQRVSSDIFKALETLPDLERLELPERLLREPALDAFKEISPGLHTRVLLGTLSSAGEMGIGRRIGARRGTLPRQRESNMSRTQRFRRAVEGLSGRAMLLAAFTATAAGAR